MTDLDDPFERDLRTLLRERAAGPLPGSLRGAAGDAVRTSGTGRLRPGGLRRPLLTLVAAAAAIVLVGASFNPISTVLEAIALPGASPTDRPVPSSSPDLTAASPVPTAAPAIDWDSGEVRLTADAIRITAGGQVFTARVPDVSVDGDPGNASFRTLEVEWQELGREQRLYVYLAADAVSWWITEIRTRDGSPNAEWAMIPPPAFRMPIGGSFRGDLSLAGDGVSLEIAGLTLTAFGPDTIPAELRFCRTALPDGQDPDTSDPLAAGHPLAGTGIESMAPAGAKQVLAGLGLCHTFRYDTPFESGAGYSELWCDPPPGVIDGVRYGSDGEVIVFVRDATRQPHTPRPQPAVGWGC